MALSGKNNLRINIPINPLSIKYKIIKCKECKGKQYKKRDKQCNLLIKRYISMNDNLKYMVYNIKSLYITNLYNIIDKYIKKNIPNLGEFKRYSFVKMYSNYVELVKTCELIYNKLLIYSAKLYTENYNSCCVPRIKRISLDIINEKKYLDF